MPIIEIQALQPARPEAVPPMLERIRDAGARALGDPPSNIWVVFHPVAREHYLLDLRSPIVTIRAKAGRTSEQREALAHAVAAAVADGLGVPKGEVWLHYLEMRPEDVYAGLSR